MSEKGEKDIREGRKRCLKRKEKMSEKEGKDVTEKGR